MQVDKQAHTLELLMTFLKKVFVRGYTFVGQGELVAIVLYLIVCFFFFVAYSTWF